MCGLRTLNAWRTRGSNARAHTHVLVEVHGQELRGPLVAGRVQELLERLLERAVELLVRADERGVPEARVRDVRVPPAQLDEPLDVLCGGLGELLVRDERAPALHHVRLHALAQHHERQAGARVARAVRPHDRRRREREQPEHAAEVVARVPLQQRDEAAALRLHELHRVVCDQGALHDLRAGAGAARNVGGEKQG